MTGRPLSQTDVGALLRTPVTAKTVKDYRRRYATTHPFPDPAGMVGRAPYWTPDQVPAIKAWDVARTGPGVGGGRPRKVTASGMTTADARAEAHHRAATLILGLMKIDGWPGAEEYGYTEEDAAAVHAQLLLLVARLERAA